MRKQGQPIPRCPSQVNGVSLEMDPVHVVVAAQPNEVPGHLVILAHGQAWQVTKQVAIDGWKRRKEPGWQQVNGNSSQSLLPPPQQENHNSASCGIN